MRLSKLSQTSQAAFAASSFSSWLKMYKNLYLCRVSLHVNCHFTLEIVFITSLSYEALYVIKHILLKFNQLEKLEAAKAA